MSHYSSIKSEELKATNQQQKKQLYSYTNKHTYTHTQIHTFNVS